MPSSTMVYNLQSSKIPKHHAYWHAVRFCLLCVTNPGQGYQSSPTTLAVIHAVWALQSVLTLGHFDHIPKIGICIAIVVVVVAWSAGTAASPRSDRGQHIPQRVGDCFRLASNPAIYFSAGLADISDRDHSIALWITREWPDAKKSARALYTFVYFTAVSGIKR